MFANGRLRAAVRQAQAEQEQAKIAFKQAVLNAGQEVNDILASQQYAQRAIALNTQQVEKLTEVLAATELRMQHDSEVNYLQVLLARQSLLEARLSLLINQYAEREGVTEELKAQDQMEWVRRMNNIRARAEEAVLHDFVHSL